MNLQNDPDSVASKAPKKRLRFSLGMLLGLVTLLGICLGLWVGSRGAAVIRVVDASTGKPIEEFEYQLIIRNSNRSRIFPAQEGFEFDPEDSEIGKKLYKGLYATAPPEGRIETSLATGSIEVDLKSERFKKTTERFDFNFWSGPREVTFRVTRLNCIRLKAVDSKGKKLPNAKVYSTGGRNSKTNRPSLGSLLSSADKNGDFPEFYHSARTFYIVANQLLPLKVEFDENSDCEIQEPLVLKRGPRIYGKVVDQNGKPWSHLRYHDGTGRWRRTDKQGRFQMHGAVPSSFDPKYEIVFGRKMASSVKSAAITPGQENIVTAPRTAPITLKVMDETGTPLKNYSVASYSSRGGTTSGSPDKNGVFRYRASDFQYIALRCKGYPCQVFDKTDCPNPAKPSFKLSKEARQISGVIERSNQTIAGLKVLFRPTSKEFQWVPSEMLPEAETSKTGAFQATDVSTEELLIEVTLANGTKITHPVRSGSAKQVNVGVIDIAKYTGALDGRIANPSGEPYGFVDFMLTDRKDRTSRVSFRTDAKGMFSIAELPAGEYELWKWGKLWKSRCFSDLAVVRQGKTSEVELFFDESESL